VILEDNAYIHTFIMLNLSTKFTTGPCLFPLLMSVEYRFEFEEMDVSNVRYQHDGSEPGTSLYQ
jgi:hypothetical protein